MSDTELCYMSAGKPASAHRRKQLSLVEVVDAVLERVERLRPWTEAKPPVD